MPIKVTEIWELQRSVVWHFHFFERDELCNRMLFFPVLDNSFALGLSAALVFLVYQVGIKGNFAFVNNNCEIRVSRYYKSSLYFELGFETLPNPYVSHDHLCISSHLFQNKIFLFITKCQKSLENLKYFFFCIHQWLYCSYLEWLTWFTWNRWQELLRGVERRKMFFTFSTKCLILIWWVGRKMWGRACSSARTCLTCSVGGWGSLWSPKPWESGFGIAAQLLRVPTMGTNQSQACTAQLLWGTRIIPQHEIMPDLAGLGT